MSGENHHGDILDTVETFLDTCPALEDEQLSLGMRGIGETPDVKTLTLTIGGTRYVVSVKASQ